MDYTPRQTKPPTQLIGENKEKFLMLKTKDNVDHAGHSLPPVH